MDDSSSSSSSDNNKQDLKCAICLADYQHPIKLACNHIFCFLCAKGLVDQRCALCRQEFRPELIIKPRVLKEVNLAVETTKSDFAWFYEGKNGWWRYDERTSVDLETEFQNSARFCVILVAGHLYKIDFGCMYQMRIDNIQRFRRVKRDRKDAPAKGVCGIRTKQEVVRFDSIPRGEDDEEEDQEDDKDPDADQSSVDEAAQLFERVELI